VVVEARPEFYGVTLFTLAGQGTLQQTTISAGGLNATAYSIKSVSGALNIIINNNDPTQTLNVTLNVPQAGVAQLIQMTGPSLAATTGMTIQGATIAPNGAFSPGPATALAGLSFYVSPLSAALVQLAAPSTPPLTIAGPTAPGSITSAYGNGLGSTVSVTDSAGVAHAATVFYDSASQINFQIPAAASIGAALVNIGTQSAAVLIQAVAPSLYTLNSAGLAAAYVIQFAGNVQTIQLVTMPVNLSVGPTYLILFGTGIRGAGSNVTVSIGGINATVTYAGPQGSTAGLDQVNVLIPPQLAGAGVVKVLLTAAGVSANPTEITIT
jgi:uncharacterized protein (TIGR03437 family)